MKKLVALAVAGAFIAPAYAAELTISGGVEFNYISTTSVTGTAGTNKLGTADSNIAIKAVEELNGIKFTGTVRMDQDAKADEQGDNGSLAMAFPNGFNVSVGDQDGALDSVGDYSDVSPELGGFSADGIDHGLRVSTPSIGGFTGYVSHSPKDGAPISTTASGTGYDSYAFKYAFPNGEVYYGVEDRSGASKVSLKAYGVKYSFSGVMVAYETGVLATPGSADKNYTGIALTYKMGNVVLGVEAQKDKTVGTTVPIVDETTMFAEYNLGSSVDIYIANESSNVSTVADRFAVGVEFNF